MRGLEHQQEQGCSLRGSYVQVPATGETGIQEPATGQTDQAQLLKGSTLYTCLYFPRRTFVLVRWRGDQDEALALACVCVSAVCVSSVCELVCCTNWEHVLSLIVGWSWGHGAAAASLLSGQCIHPTPHKSQTKHVSKKMTATSLTIAEAFP